MVRRNSRFAAAALAVGLSLCGCGAQSAPAQAQAAASPAQPPASPTAQQEAPLSPAPQDDASPSLQPAVTLPTPLLLVSAGQSADVLVFKAVLDDLGASYLLESDADSVDIDDFASIAMVVGASNKGLTLEQRSADQELSRIRTLLDAADDGTILLVAHLGGSMRRGGLTDRLLELALPRADVIVTVTGGDRDGLFSKAAQARSIPFLEAASSNGLSELLSDMLDLPGK